MPATRATPKGYEHARRLRTTPTPAEAKLWAFLRGSKLGGVSFRRQHAIGRYVVDFCALKHRLIIELDESAHLAQTHGDAQRTSELASLGYRVIRFWNHQIMNDFDGVIRAILDALNLV